MDTESATHGHCCCCHNNHQRSSSSSSPAMSSRRTHRNPEKCIRNSLMSRTTVSSILRTSLCLILTHLCLSRAEPAKYLPDTPRFQPKDMSTFQGLNGAIKYYRYLDFNEDHSRLYVGAMNFLIQLDTNDIQNNPKISRNITDSDVDKNRMTCTDQGKSTQFDCQNHIRTVIPRAGDKLEICGTAAFDTITFLFDAGDITGPFTQGEKGVTARLLCSRNPSESCTSLYVGQGNAGDEPEIYTGSLMDSHDSPVIYRPGSVPLRSDAQNSWLNQPTFVAMYEMGDYVYIFLRELAVEYTSYGEMIYSRIARVCKNDRGGTRVLEYHWTTYFKARLNCSIPGDFPFYFNELHDVYQTNDGMFYGVFTSNLNGMYGSAVCAFTQDSIQAAFDGPFTEQPDSDHNWVRVPNSQVPVPRPGRCDVNSLTNPDSHLHFIKAHPLMDEAVSAQYAAPLFYQQEMIFSKVVVDQIPRSGILFNVFFLAADDGSVHKVVSWSDNFSPVQSKTVAIWRDFTNGPIQQMKFYNQNLYLSTDDKVVQIPIGSQCDKYEYCTQCIQDPHCGWDPNWNDCTQDTERFGVVQNVTAEFPEKVCGRACNNGHEHNHTATIQDSVHFECSSQCEPSGDVAWYYNSRLVPVDYRRFFLTSESGLVALNVTVEDSGHYECRSNGIVLTKHTLNVTGCTDRETCWRLEFDKWCKEFEVYKREFSHWQCLKDHCTSDETCVPRDYADQCPP